jgi:AMMECR1 domain-containing protein
MFFLNLFETLNDIYYLRQINAFSSWLLKNSLENEVVFIGLPHQERFLKGNFFDKTKQKPSFVLCRKNGLNEALEKNNLNSASGWQSIFLSNEFGIWENKEKYHSENLPIRFGLTEKEKEEVLNHSRYTLESFLKKGGGREDYSRTIAGRFSQKVNIDVALWVGGELRGSRIVENLPFWEAIEEATIRACRDERFKPLSFEELSSTTIEIAILSSLRIPLLKKEKASSVVYTEKGYLMSVNGKQGWFLPAVFNCVAFNGLGDFLVNLIEKKIGVSRLFLPKAIIEIFEVDNFIESTKKKPLSLSGPIVLSNNYQNDLEEKEIYSRFYESVNKSADFICRVQENDGNIPPVINPLTGKMSQIDWVRLALTAWALSLWGETTKNDLYKESARKSFSYLRENLYDHPYIPAYSRCLSLIYYRRLAIVLNEHKEAEKSGEVISSLIHDLDYEPILYSQIAAHLIDVASQNNDCLKKAEEFVGIVSEDYERGIKENKLELARYPELIYLLKELGKKTNNKELLLSATKISEWFVAEQLKDGSFPSLVDSIFSYVRGTGKIFEVLSLNLEKNKKVIEKTMLWIMDMQYTKENTFFVKEDVKGKILGGFRHDNLNQEVWIDATAHVLIGASRLKKTNGA